MERAEKENAERMKRKTIQKAAVDIKKFRLKAGKWDGIAEIRKWRELG
jgi:hypothetical protein